jgi:hypothetical protein
MKVIALTVVVALLAGCSATRSQSGISPTAQRAMSELRVGMSGEDAVAAMRPVCHDWGRVNYGGTGASRLYFQLGANQQIWLEVSGAPEFVVTTIGTPEPKTKWTRSQETVLQFGEAA